MLTHQSGLFQETKFRPLGCWPLKVLQALEIDQRFLAHTPNWDGGLPKIIKGNRISWTCCRFLHWGPSYIHFCRAVVFASARFSRHVCTARIVYL